MKNLDFKGALNVKGSSVVERRDGDSFDLPDVDLYIEEYIKKLAKRGIFFEIGDKINEVFLVASIEFYFMTEEEIKEENLNEDEIFSFWIELERIERA